MFAVMKMKKEFAHTVGESLSLPPETIAEVPLTSLRGKRSVCIENHRGILAYTDECVKVAVKRGSISVFGTHLTIARMTRGCLEIRGHIRSIELE